MARRRSLREYVEAMNPSFRILIEEPEDKEDAGEDDEEEGGDVDIDIGEPEGGDDVEPDAGDDAEPDEEPRPDIHEPEDSLDRQIDAILVGFEKDAIDQAQEVYEESITLRTPLRFLFEAPDDKEDGEDEETVDDSDVKADEPEKPEKPKIDIDVFAQKVSRLVNNYDALIDIRAAIIDRVMKYIEENYDDDTSSKLAEILEQEYNITSGGKGDYPEEGPSAVGADIEPSATGGGGGGFEAGGGDLGGGEL